MIKLIASDVDGTLINDEQRQIRPELFDLIRAFRARGIGFAVASGRQYANLRRLFAPVADEISYICENGALVVHEGRVLFRDEIERAAGRRLIREIMARPGCEPLLSGVDTCYVRRGNPSFAGYMADHVGNVTTVVDDLCAVEEPFLKISLYNPEGIDEEIHRYFNDLVHPEMKGAIGGRRWLDFFHIAVHKGTALAQLQAMLGIQPEECMVFGDNENDIELMRQAGYSYAMTNGHPRTRAQARFETDDVVCTLADYFRQLG
ncbi:MAG: Cof-type HAD-IIB family hydrolase [Butyricicoccaceae bacterium]